MTDGQGEGWGQVTDGNKTRALDKAGIGACMKG